MALTKQLGRLHAKALFSSSVSRPQRGEPQREPGIRPERTRVFELEAGYQLTDALSVSANAFDIHIGQPIVYAFDPVAGGDTYRNFERSGTRGAELEYALQGAWGRAQLRYSLYTATGEERVPTYETDHPGTLLGLPNHRVSLAGVARLPGGFTLAPTLHLFGPRARAEGTDTAGATRYAREPTQLLANLFLQREDAFVRGLTLGAGLYNALRGQFRFAQPTTTAGTRRCPATTASCSRARTTRCPSRRGAGPGAPRGRGQSLHTVCSPLRAGGAAGAWRRRGRAAGPGMRAARRAAPRGSTPMARAEAKPYTHAPDEPPRLRSPVIACAGHLALAILAVWRDARGPLARPLALLSIDMFVWNFAALAYSVSACASGAGWRPPPRRWPPRWCCTSS